MVNVYVYGAIGIAVGVDECERRIVITFCVWLRKSQYGNPYPAARHSSNL